MSENCKECGRPLKKGRSNEQNRYYWGVCIALLSEHTGFDREEMHEILKRRFLRHTVWVHHKDGIQEQVVISKTTTKLTTKQFEEFLTGIRQWSAQDLGVVLPEPNEILVP